MVLHVDLAELEADLHFELDENWKPRFWITATDSGIFRPSPDQESIGPAEAIFDAGLIMPNDKFCEWTFEAGPYEDPLGLGSYAYLDIESPITMDDEEFLEYVAGIHLI